MTNGASPDRVRGIIVAHGTMAAGLVEAATRISGVEEGALVAISNDGLGPEELQAAILSDAAGVSALVFTDLAAGSCTLAARICCSKGAPLAVVAGVNLAMVLDFLFHRDMPLDELVEHVVARGKQGVRALATPDRASPAPTDSADVDPALPR